MPIFEFKCSSCQLKTEELFFPRDTVPDSIDCSCGDMRDRIQVYSLGIIGPVWDKLEEYNNTLLSPQERASGKELRTNKDIKNWEKERGLVRMDPSSSEARIYAEQNEEESQTIKNLHKTDGRSGVVDYLDKTSILEGTSWDSSQYNRWKEANDAAESRIDAGVANVGDDAGTGATAASD
jgi:hypothetical protein